MAVPLQNLISVIYKQGSQKNAPDPGAQAMMMAAQAAKPAGAPPLPKAIDPGEEEQEDQAQDIDKIIKEKDSELEKAKKENEKLRHDLNKTELAHQEELMMRELEKKEKEGLEKIRQEQESLKNEKTIHQAEAIQHKADLEKETAQAQVKLEQQKSKALIDFNKQQMLQEMKTLDETRKQQTKYIDDSKKEVDKYTQDARKNIDGERQAFEQSKSAISPALQTVMDNALSKLHKIPTPGAQPLIMSKKAYEVEFTRDLDSIGATAGKLVAPQYTASQINKKIDPWAGWATMAGRVGVSLGNKDQQRLVDNWSLLSMRNKKALGGLLSPENQAKVGIVSDPRLRAENYNKRLLAAKKQNAAYRQQVNPNRTSVDLHKGNSINPTTSIYKSPYDRITGDLYSTLVPGILNVARALDINIGLPGYSPSTVDPYKPIDARSIQHEQNNSFKDSRLRRFIPRNQILSTRTPGASQLYSFLANQ